MPIHLNVWSVGVAAKFDGLLLRETDSGAVFKASAEVSAADATAALAEWGIAAPAPLAGRPFALGGQLRLDAASGDFEEGQLRLGPANAAAGVHRTLDCPRPRVSLRVAALSIDLDAWAAQRVAAVPGFALVAAASTAEPAPPSALPLPKDVDVAFDLSTASVLWRGQAAQSVVAEGDVSRGGLVLNQVSAELPGAAQVRAFGFVGAARRSLDLTVQASAANLRGVLDWLGIDVSGVPSDRLRLAGLAAQISGGKDELLWVHDIDLALDASRAKGALDLCWGPRPAFGLSLVVDQLNLDAYRPQPTQPVASSSPVVAGNLSPAPAPWQGVRRQSRSFGRPPHRRRPAARPGFGQGRVAGRRARRRRALRRFRRRGPPARQRQDPHRRCGCAALRGGQGRRSPSTWGRSLRRSPPPARLPTSSSISRPASAT